MKGRKERIMKKTLAILLSLALVICMIPGTAFAETAPKELKSDMVSLDNETFVYNGSVQKPTVTVKDGETTLAADTNYTIEWSEASPTAAGTYTVTVTGKATEAADDTDYTGTVSKTFKIAAIDMVTASITLKYGGELTANPIDGLSDAGQIDTALKAVFDVKQGGIDVSDRCTLSATLKNNVLTVKATISGSVDASVINSTKSETFTIKTPLSDVTIDSVAAQTYSGKAIEPAVTIKKGSTVLKKGTDYTVAYSNNTDASSQATITVTGMGSYTGYRTVTFTINPKELTDSNVTVSTAAEDTANGADPEVVVTVNSKVLTEGTDYDVTVSGNYGAAGTTGTVLVEGKGNYDGKITKSFSIVDASKELTADNTDVYIGGLTDPYTYETYYTGSEQKPSVTVYFNNSLLSSSYYTVTYSNNTDAGTGATVTVTGKGIYAGTVSKTFTIKETPITYGTISGVSSSYAYTGMPITPTVSLYIDGKLIDKKYYDVRYSNNTQVSTSYSKGTVTITPAAGSGFTGSCSTTFTIVAKNISACTTEFVGGKSTVAYTGSVVTPDVTVRDGYKVLSRYSDYSVTYTDPAGKTVTTIKDAGTYTVNITGKGNYTGTKTMTFNVTGTDISKYTVTLKTATVAANGKVQNPVVSSVTYGTTSKLTTNDYTISYQDADGKTVTSITAPGTYKVIATGKNGYSGNAVSTYKVTGKAQSVKVTKDYYSIYETSDIFKISATATGDGTGFTYKSSDPTVAYVSSTGVVTPVKPGYTVITVSTTGTKLYEPAKETVSVKVAPAKAMLSRKPWTGGVKKQLKVRWDYEGNATKYQVRYSTSKNFSTYKSKTVKAHGKDYTTQSTTIKNLTSNKTYYFKVRAIYETVDENGEKVTCYGKWSNWKSGKTK